MEIKGTYGSGEHINPVAAPTASGSSPGFFSPMNLIKVVLRRWWVVALFALVGAVIGYIHGRLAPRIYKAQAELEMSVRRPKVINNEAVFDDSAANDEDVIFNTRFRKFKSPAMEELATEEYFKRYPEDEASKGGGIEREKLAWLIREYVNWYKDPSANIVYVSFYSEDPEFAARLVNNLAHCAGLLMMQENRTLSDEAVKWLLTQLDDQREELEGVELELAKMREELQLDSLEQRQSAVGQALVTVTGEREALVSSLASQKTIHSFLEELKGTDPNLEVLPSGLPREEQLNELINDWRAAKENMMLAADRYTEKHPEYRQQAEIEARAKERLQAFIELSIKNVQYEIDLLGKQLEQVDDRIAKLKQEAIDLEQQLVIGTQRVQRLERKRDAADNTYQSMLRRMEEARLSADENMAFTKIIRGAEVPKVPSSPSRVKILITALFIGSLIGGALVILLAFALDKIESVADLKALGLNVLGVIPSQKKKESRIELATIGLNDKFHHIVEVFAGINAVISSSKYAEHSKMLLVCSVMPEEGKTMSSCNLAISSALNGMRTLLIDGDLRRPQLANVFDVNEVHPSLLEWLSGNGSGLRHEDLLSKGVIQNLDVITSRHLEGTNPAELLGRGNLVELLEWARKEYDRVIIDSPPLGPVGDAQIFANLADSAILVSRIGKTRKRGLHFVLSRLREIEAPVLGCIANDVPNSLAGLFGGAEGYGYGYGYSGNYKS